MGAGITAASGIPKARKSIQQKTTRKYQNLFKLII